MRKIRNRNRCARRAVPFLALSERVTKPFRGIRAERRRPALRAGEPKKSHRPANGRQMQRGHSAPLTPPRFRAPGPPETPRVRSLAWLPRGCRPLEPRRAQNGSHAQAAGPDRARGAGEARRAAARAARARSRRSSPETAGHSWNGSQAVTAQSRGFAMRRNGSDRTAAESFEFVQRLIALPGVCSALRA